MLHIAICDDDKNITVLLQELLSKKYNKSMIYHCVHTSQDLITLIQNDQADIVILDIALGEEDGISIAKSLGKEYPHIKIILLSGFAQLASNVFDAEPVTFLSKPIQENKLYAAIDKATEMLKDQSKAVVNIAEFGGKINRIPVSEIVCLETGNRCCNVYLENKTMIESPAKLKDIMTLLPDYFIFTHQSYACNLNKVKSFSKEEGVLLTNDLLIPVSRRHYKSVKETISLHI